MNCLACALDDFQNSLAGTGKRIVETLASNGATTNVFAIPRKISLDFAVKQQGDAKFRDSFFLFSYPTGTSKEHTC